MCSRQEVCKDVRSPVNVSNRDPIREMRVRFALTEHMRESDMIVVYGDGSVGNKFGVVLKCPN